MSGADALPHASRPSPGKRISMVLAVAVHLLLLGVLFYGIRWQDQAAAPVEVDLVRAEAPSVTPPSPLTEPPPPEPAPAPEPKLETKVEPKLEPKPEVKVEAEPAPPPKPDIVIKEKLKPAPHEKPVPKEPPKPPPKEPKPVSDPFKKQLEQDLQQTAARKSAEAANAAATQELSQLKASQAAAAHNNAIADYIGKIRGKIKGNIVLPPDLKGNPEAVFDVVQLPSGEILSVKLKKSSGNAGYDAAVERAILKSSPLPKPGQSDLFSRELELKFRPLEE